MNDHDNLTYWHLAIAYDGKNYSGWQIQPHQKTVQGELLQRLRLLLRAPELRIYGSSRTDAGVHSLDQQVSFAAVMPEAFTPSAFVEKLNRWLPDDILIKAARICPEPFNARYDNTGKAYTYCLAPGKKINPLWSRFVWRTPRPLDLLAMREAAQYLVGVIDFASFGVNPGRELDSTIRKIQRLEILEQDGLYYVNILGESFLYKMVRSITGYLVHIGLGHARPENTEAVLQGRNRSLAADSAPAQGLFLAKVFFAPEEWRDYRPLLPPFRLLPED